MEQQALTQEELQQLKEVRAQVLQLASTLGEISYQQILLDLDKAKATDGIKDLRVKEQLIFAELGKKYGDGVINIETGVVEPR